MSTDKSDFRKRLDALSDEQLQQVGRDYASARAARGDNAEFRQKVSNMTDHEFAQLTAELNR
ncbi:hypothetical protein I6F36_05750 [Bradyrhizobium sp. BRP19]|uniref:hypothetical protein n=1 Tax=Bradyrhizobium sp. BRP19 TaxID=2793823 RepID=UPI001CD66FB5|nr:hypothetical protein [Bradyrhizobium sp. BRP19]MCA1546307.1 hypothetical protein [Bradyrhizobium sp. BRP19]